MGIIYDTTIFQNHSKMLADLIQGYFKGKKFKFHQTDVKSGQRKVMELGG